MSIWERQKSFFYFPLFWAVISFIAMTPNLLLHCVESTQLCRTPKARHSRVISTALSPGALYEEQRLDGSTARRYFPSSFSVL